MCEKGKEREGGIDTRGMMRRKVWGGEWCIIVTMGKELVLMKLFGGK